jgi:hypothetical protein
MDRGPDDAGGGPVAVLSQVSSTGSLAVVAATGSGPVRGQSLAPAQAEGPPGTPQPVRIVGWVTATGRNVSFTVPTGPRLTEAAAASRLPGPGGAPGTGTGAAPAMRVVRTFSAFGS